MWRGVTETVTPLVRDFVSRIRNEQDNAVLTETWTFGISSLCLSMKKKQWEMLLEMIGPSSPPALAARKEVRDAAMRGPGTQYWKDQSQYFIFRLHRHQRVTEMRYMETGILAPLGSTLEKFDTPNP
jgi:hypothetical protein